MLQGGVAVEHLDDLYRDLVNVWTVGQCCQEHPGYG